MQLKALKFPRKQTEYRLKIDLKKSTLENRLKSRQELLFNRPTTQLLFLVRAVFNRNNNNMLPGLALKYETAKVSVQVNQLHLQDFL